MFWLLVAGLFLIFLAVFGLLFIPPRFSMKGAHVLITGGSKGIGRAVAIEAARRGASITLFARDLEKLQEAKEEVENNVQDPQIQKVQTLSVDVSGDAQKVNEAVENAEKRFGPVDMLINCAGISYAGEFETTPLAQAQKLFQVNVIGSMAVTQATLKHMKVRRMGRIAFISSQAGQLGLYGYAAYSSSKFALMGLAQALRMEVKPYNIGVTISFPPDTDTEGFREELPTKPEECRLISETSGFFQPDVVAKRIVDDTVNGKFASYIGLDGWMLSIISAGMSPVGSVREIIEQVFLMSIFRLISFFYLANFDRIVRLCQKKKTAAAAKTD